MAGRLRSIPQLVCSPPITGSEQRPEAYFKNTRSCLKPNRTHSCSFAGRYVSSCSVQNLLQNLGTPTKSLPPHLKEPAARRGFPCNCRRPPLTNDGRKGPKELPFKCLVKFFKGVYEDSFEAVS